MASIHPSQTSSLAQCLRLAPLAILSILVYIALPSRFILPPDLSLAELDAAWHPALAGWYDGMLGGAMLVTWLVHGLKTEPKLTAFAYLSLLAAVLSLVFGYPNVSPGLLGASAIYWFRWTALFC